MEQQRECLRSSTGKGMARSGGDWRWVAGGDVAVLVSFWSAGATCGDECGYHATLILHARATIGWLHTVLHVTAFPRCGGQEFDYSIRRAQSLGSISNLLVLRRLVVEGGQTLTLLVVRKPLLIPARAWRKNRM